MQKETLSQKHVLQTELDSGRFYLRKSQLSEILPRVYFDLDPPTVIDYN